MKTFLSGSPGGYRQVNKLNKHQETEQTHRPLDVVLQCADEPVLDHKMSQYHVKQAFVCNMKPEKVEK